MKSRTTHSRDRCSALEKMDSRLLYKLSEFRLNEINWKKDGAEEWIHFGTGSDINTRQIEKFVFDFLSSEKFYKVHTRTNSALISKTEVGAVLQELLGRSKFVLWSFDQSRVIQFSEIGVMRKGIRD